MCIHVKRYIQKRIIHLADEARDATPERAAAIAETITELRAILETIDLPPRTVVEDSDTPPRDAET